MSSGDKVHPTPGTDAPEDQQNGSVGALPRSLASRSSSSVLDDADLEGIEVVDELLHTDVVPTGPTTTTTLTMTTAATATIGTNPPTPAPTTPLPRLVPRFDVRSHLRASTHGTARLSTTLRERVASFHKKALKSSALVDSGESHLKISMLTSSDISTLHFVMHSAAILGPILQILWVTYVEPDIPPVYDWSPDPWAFHLGVGNSAEALLQTFIVVAALLFIRRTLLDKQRQAIQVIVATIAAIAVLICVLIVASNILQGFRVSEKQGRRLLSFANALMAGFLHVTVSYLSGHYAVILLETSECNPLLLAKFRARHQLMGHVALVASALYVGLRVMVAWHSDMVFDFLPAANCITPIRLWLCDSRAAFEAFAIDETIIVSVADIAITLTAFYRAYFVRLLFHHVFVKDFARLYTEFSIFVLYLCKTIVLITLSGYIATWATPMRFFFDGSYAPEDTDEVLYSGSVQMQLGFRFTWMVWLFAVMFCALPSDSRGLKGWCRPRSQAKHIDKEIRYFLYESDVHTKKAFRNLAHINHIDPRHFILENHVEAFNFAQLAYARGNKHYGQELNSLQHLVGDANYKIIDALHDRATDTHSIIVASETKIVVAFRGTSSTANAKTDLQSSMTPHLTAKLADLAKIASERPWSRVFAVERTKIRTVWHRLLCKRNDPKVHSGFYRAYLAVADAVLDRIRQLHLDDARPILVTGHSLGGALAILCGFDIVSRLKITNVACTTFGCPRVGNHAFKKIYAQAVPATFAFVNASDMITKLPPKTPKAQSYTPVGTIVLINSYGNLVIEPNVLELDILHSGYSARAHTMRSYQLSLLLWCLRSHRGQYRPAFWRQSLTFLQSTYGTIPEVREYLRHSVLLDAHLQQSIRRLPLSGDEETADPSPAPVTDKARLRGVVRMLDATLHRDQEEAVVLEITAASLVDRARRWLRQRRDPTEWFATNDAIRILLTQVPLKDETAAIELGQVLAVHGFIRPRSVIFGRDGEFCFSSMIDKDDEEDDEGEGEGEGDDDGDGADDNTLGKHGGGGVGGCPTSPPAIDLASG